jgi:hypothetical protein
VRVVAQRRPSVPVSVDVPIKDVVKPGISSPIVQKTTVPINTPNVKATVVQSGKESTNSAPAASDASNNKTLARKMSGSPVQFRTVPSLEKLFPSIVSPAAQRFTPSGDSSFTASPRTIKPSPQNTVTTPTVSVPGENSVGGPVPSTLNGHAQILRTQSSSNVVSGQSLAPDPTIIQIEPTDSPRRKGQLPILSLTTLSATRSQSNLLDPASLYAASVNAVNTGGTNETVSSADDSGKQSNLANGVVNGIHNSAMKKI